MCITVLCNIQGSLRGKKTNTKTNPWKYCATCLKKGLQEIVTWPNVSSCPGDSPEGGLYSAEGNTPSDHHLLQPFLQSRFHSKSIIAFFFLFWPPCIIRVRSSIIIPTRRWRHQSVLYLTQLDIKQHYLLSYIIKSYIPVITSNIITQLNLLVAWSAWYNSDMSALCSTCV